MRDVTAHLQSAAIGLVAEAARSSRGVCGPIFGTSLAELAFERFRPVVGRRYSPKTVGLASDTVLDRVLSTAASVPPTRALPHEVASHD